VVEDLIEASLLLFKFGSGFLEILYLFLLLVVLALLVLEFLFEEGIPGQGFLELRLQPLHRNGMTLFHPLKSGLHLGSIFMAELMAEY
jgi:hypothetical protein